MPSSNSLHLLRALLRECTYLPDPAARAYFHEHILSRYRVYVPRCRHGQQPATESTSHLLPSSTRQTYLLRTARHSLAFLQRANNGHLDALLKVLSLTYGRTGKRRHQLLSPLLAPDTPSDHTAVASLSASVTTSTNPHLPSKLNALLKGQYRQKRLEMVRPQIKEMRPRIPETNSWRRPLPVKRVLNLKKRWFKMVLERALPPLPESEWERLRRLANGESTWEGPVRRRAWAKKTTEENEDTLLTKDFLSNPLEENLALRRQASCGNPHRLSRRFMQRLWGRVFTQCPVLTWNATKKIWQVQWGTVGSANALEQPTMGTPERSIFNGVDEKGEVLRQLPECEGLEDSCP